jgi:hypothetical protein
MKKLAVFLGGVLLSISVAVPSSAGTGSCSVAPTHVALSSPYNVSIHGPANKVIYVWISYNGGWKDGFGLTTDASGNARLDRGTFSYSSTVGYAKVSVVANDGSKQKIANCGFEITG